MDKLSLAASLMGKRSAKARAKKWGKQEFLRRMREWGELGGRPRKAEGRAGGKRAQPIPRERGRTRGRLKGSRSTQKGGK